MLWAHTQSIAAALWMYRWIIFIFEIFLFYFVIFSACVLGARLRELVFERLVAIKLWLIFCALHNLKLFISELYFNFNPLI